MERENKIAPNKRRSIGLEKVITSILLLAALAITLTLITGEGLIHRKPTPQPAIPEQANTPPEPMEPSALAALEAFFEAPDLASKAALVRDGARVRPLMQDFHEHRGHPFPTLGRVSPGKSARFDETPMVLFEVEPFSGPRYFVAVAWDGQRFAVDWETLTAYGTMDWSEFIQSLPTAPQTLRVFIRNAAQTDRPPGTPDTIKFFHIEHRDHPQPLIAAASAEVAAILGPLVENRRAPVTLEILWKPATSGTPVVPWIHRVVSEKWSP
jgi:hypothetical protein